MTPITLGASAWEAYPAAARQLIARVASEGADTALIIDFDAVSRETCAEPPADDRNWHEMSLNDWLRSGLNPDGVLEAAAIRRAADGVPSDRIIWLDARSHRGELVMEALGHLRHAWYYVDNWHPAFVVVCDDDQLLTVSAALSETFYSQPQPMTSMEANRLLRDLRRQAWTYRFFGPAVAKRWQQWIFRVAVNRVLNWQDRREKRIEVGV
jgi:hypothetical protein